MKTRIGFVSNSSSASYIVRVKDITEDEFCRRLFEEYSWTHFSKKKMTRELKKRLKQQRKCAEDYIISSPEAEGLNKIFKKQASDYIDRLEGLQKELSEIDEDKKLVEFTLKYCGIHTTIMTDGGIEMLYFTSMHNDYHDGTNELLREIILFFMFETDRKVECEVNHDN